MSVIDKASAVNVMAQAIGAIAINREGVTASRDEHNVLPAAEAEAAAINACSPTQDLHLQLTYLESQAAEQLPVQKASQQSKCAQQTTEVAQSTAQQAQHVQQAQHAQQDNELPQPAAQHAQHAQQTTGMPMPAAHHAQQAQCDQQDVGPDNPNQPAAASGASPAKLSLNLDTQLPEEAAPNVRATPGKGLQKSPQPGRQSWWNQPWSVAQLSEESQTLPTGLSHEH